MRVLNRLAALAVASLVALLPLSVSAQDKPPLKVEVLRTSAGSLHSNASLIMGEREAVLVDPPFTKADAHRVAAMVLDSGKILTTIFVTHDHPDHYFSMDVLAEAFPDAKIVAHPTVVADIWRSLPYKVKRWSPLLGANGPAHPSAPALWSPDIKALFAGDLVFNQMYLWLGEHTPADVAAWDRSLAEFEKLRPEMVVAGHAKPGLPNDASGIAFTRAFLQAWPGLVAASKDAKDMQARVRAAFPEAIDILDGFLLVNSTEVAKGEQPRWEE